MNLVISSISQKLLSCLEHVMMDWAYLGVDYLGEPASPPARLPLERKVRLQGDQLETTLVLRGTTGLGEELARSVKGEPGPAVDGGRAAFSDLAVLLAEEWRKRESAGNPVEWKPLASEPSSPDTWPEGPPDACVVATVKGWGLEILLWAPAVPHYLRMN